MADFSRLPGPNADLWDWQLVAACRGVDSSLFFHPEGERGAARSARETSAKEVCMRCPVRAECATHALAVREPYGVWGGLTEDEREAMMGRSRSRVSEVEAETDFDPESESESESDFEAESAADDEAESRTDFEADSRTDFEADSGADFEADYETDFEVSEEFGSPEEMAELERMSGRMSGSAGVGRR